jgi:hypothetical protein
VWLGRSGDLAPVARTVDGHVADALRLDDVEEPVEVVEDLRVRTHAGALSARGRRCVCALGAIPSRRLRVRTLSLARV